MAAFFMGDGFVTTPTPSGEGLCVPLMFVIVDPGFVGFWYAKGEKYD
jgi:hypothetical protein